GATLKFLVRAANPAGYDVDVHAPPRGVVRVAVVARKLALIYAVETPGRVVLRRVLLRGVLRPDRLDADLGIRRTVRDTLIPAERQGLRLAHLHRIALERVCICPLDLRAVG